MAQSAVRFHFITVQLAHYLKLHCAHTGLLQPVSLADGFDYLKILSKAKHDLIMSLIIVFFSVAELTSWAYAGPFCDVHAHSV